MIETGSKNHISVVATDSIGKNQIVRLLQASMPCGRQEDFLPFAELVCGGKGVVTVGELLINCFVNTVIPFTPVEEGEGAVR